MKKRIFEIDILRFIAIVLMVLYHLAYDITYYLDKNINFEGLGWTIVGKTAAFLFIFVSGISSGFSKDTFKRGLKVFGFGMIITLATFIFIRGEYVRFGILHFLGACMMLYPLLYRLNNGVLLILAVFSFFMGLVFDKMFVDTFLLIPFGLYYRSFASIDYYPIFPYISIFIVGILAYKLYYYKKQSIFKMYFDLVFINFISRNSLVIYLIHQPILLAIIFIIKLLYK
ncbi:Acyltransferase family protein [Caloramator mitchellensis]|uniref:Acyltransferase family protein n=1 Tax=Caloramator mitchellensis TaxID=908809 RepID=A0A0R3K5L0_CALMK|nr:heparan-alpha-glucosaminide N-acetyltransferase [Caloramator mitchellensis]KRQ87663.1 Acyltransferase family protein [Caloramator mitchellensis]